MKAYLLDVRQEIKKVSWPTFQELRSSTGVVIVVSILISVFIFSIDTILTWLVRLLLR